MSPPVVYVVAGLALLLAVVLPRALTRFAVSAPMVLVGLGMLLGLVPGTETLDLDPVANRVVVEHVSEVAVLVALMGVGLALDRPLSPLDRESWRRWSATWRLLLVAMPLCIGALALFGWAGLGIAGPAAVLLGAVLAPTDPVLASDVQVEGPGIVTDSGVEEVDEHDEVRFALTSEAGLNDGLAFPFVTAAVLLAGSGTAGFCGLRWLAWDVVGKVVLGVAVGLAVGWLLARVAFRSTLPPLRLAEQGEPLLALAALLTAYGVAELTGGYGFLAVFTCAMTIRAAERGHDYHRAMHEVTERLERLLTLLVLLVLGLAMTHGLLANLDWRGVLVALALLLLVRPGAGLLALGWGRWAARGGSGRRLCLQERWATAFLGVRGVGSVYYLAHAGGLAAYPEERWLWSTVAFTIILSVLLHGVSATPVMRRLERTRRAAAP